MDDSVKKALTHREKCRQFQETQSWHFILCNVNSMSTLPRLRLLTQLCRWCRSTSWGKRMGTTTGQVHATEAKNHFATWSQKWRQWSWMSCEAQTEGNFGMPPSKPIFVVDLIRLQLVWHFWLNSVLVFILSLQKNTSRVCLVLCF